ncbi:hypothetical protein J4206_02955 [Candidatus Woesearchaeota archaeon]|nr:hypothetical protein [Candidatus Woesearchaeota archaeon]
MTDQENKQKPDGISRRNLLKIIGSTILVDGIAESQGVGVVTGLKSLYNWFSQEDSALQKQLSDYEIIVKRLQEAGYEVSGKSFEGCDTCILYVSDIHTTDIQERNISVIKQISTLIPIGVIGLEGLEEVIDNALSQKIRQGIQEFLRIKKEMKSVDEEIDKLIGDLPNFGDNLVRIAANDIKSNRLSRGLYAKTLQEGECNAPGSEYADALYGNVPQVLFGVENLRKYIEHENVGSGFLVQNPLLSIQKALPIIAKEKEEMERNGASAEDIIKVEAYVQFLQECESKLRDDLAYYQSLTGISDFLDDGYLTTTERLRSERSQIAVDNLMRFMGQKGIKIGIMVYGANHDESMIQELARKKQNYVVVK